MLDIKSIDFTDFYFNGHWLSEFGCFVASPGGLPLFSLYPSKNIEETYIIGKDNPFVTNIVFEPRVFTIPIYIPSYTILRDLASWLYVRSPQDFYWKNDRVKIKAITNVTDNLELFTYESVCEVKFIAHDPYFYLINDLVYTFTNFSNPITFFNDGNVESYPLIEVEGSGNISCTINNQDFILNNMSGKYIVDNLLMAVYDSANNNRLANFVGNFVILQPGNNVLSVVGNCTKLTITCRSRFI